MAPPAERPPGLPTDTRAKHQFHWLGKALEESGYLDHPVYSIVTNGAKEPVQAVEALRAYLKTDEGLALPPDLKGVLESGVVRIEKHLPK